MALWEVVMSSVALAPALALTATVRFQFSPALLVLVSPANVVRCAPVPTNDLPLAAPPELGSVDVPQFRPYPSFVLKIALRH